MAGKDEPQQVLRWIQNRITCRIPEEDSNPELYQLVTKYQQWRRSVSGAPHFCRPQKAIVRERERERQLQRERESDRETESIKERQSHRESESGGGR